MLDAGRFLYIGHKPFHISLRVAVPGAKARKVYVCGQKDAGCFLEKAVMVPQVPRGMDGFKQGSPQFQHLPVLKPAVRLTQRTQADPFDDGLSPVVPIFIIPCKPLSKLL